MKKIIYLPEGDYEDFMNYSGTPLYFGEALKYLAMKKNMDFIVISTKEIINTEDVWRIAQKKIENNMFPNEYLSKINYDFTPNCILLDKIEKASNYKDILNAVKNYDEVVSNYVNKKIFEKYVPGDFVISLNPYNPIFSIDIPNCLYLDTSLYEFYFIREKGFLSFLKDEDVLNYYYLLEKQAVEKATVVFTFSKACEKQLKELYPNIKTSVVYAGVNINYTRFIF